MGVRVSDIANAGRSKNRSGITEGVVIIDVSGDSYLGRIGVRAGDVIRQIDEMKISGKEDFEKAMIKYRRKRSVIILLQRENEGYYITVQLNRA